MEAGFKMDGFACFLIRHPVIALPRNDRFQNIFRSCSCPSGAVPAHPSSCGLWEIRTGNHLVLLSELPLLGAAVSHFPVCS